ncbi:MAG: hypothetical protein ACHQUB_00140 [Candidatus Saccharimonadia bacterium]
MEDEKLELPSQYVEPVKNKSAIKKPLVISGLLFGVCLVSFLAMSLVRFVYKNYPPQPNPISPKVSTNRKNAFDTINNEFSTINYDTGLTTYASGSSDICYKDIKGEFSLTPNSYTYECTILVTKFYGLNDFGQTMIILETALQNNNWSITNSYYSQSVGDENSFIGPDFSNPQPFFGGMGPFNNKSGTTININYQDGKSLPNSTELSILEVPEVPDNGGDIYNRNLLVSAQTILKGATSKSYPYILSLGITSNYYSN